MTNKRRSRFDIVADILIALEAQHEHKLKPTHIMYKANLSHKLLKEYLADLNNQELIVDEIGKPFIKLTDKGRDFLRKFREFSAFRSTFGV
jgi:predicted transcriptional regulator